MHFIFEAIPVKEGKVMPQITNPKFAKQKVIWVIPMKEKLAVLCSPTFDTKIKTRGFFSRRLDFYSICLCFLCPPHSRD